MQLVDSTLGNEGVLIFSGDNYTYGGGTDVEYGTLQLANAFANPGAPNTPLTIGVSGTFDLNGVPTYIGSLYDGYGGGGTITNTSNSGLAP